MNTTVNIALGNTKVVEVNNMGYIFDRILDEDDKTADALKKAIIAIINEYDYEPAEFLEEMCEIFHK